MLATAPRPREGHRPAPARLVRHLPHAAELGDVVAKHRQGLRRPQRREHDLEAERRRERQRHRRGQRQRDQPYPTPVSLPGEVHQEQRLNYQRQRKQLVAVYPEQVRQRYQGQCPRPTALKRVQRQQLDAERDHREHVGAQHHPALQRPQPQHPQDVKACAVAKRSAPAHEQQERRHPADGGGDAQPLPARGAQDQPHRRLERRVLLKYWVTWKRVAERVERRPVASVGGEPCCREVPGEVHGHRAHQRKRDGRDGDQPAPPMRRRRALSAIGAAGRSAADIARNDYRRVIEARQHSRRRS